MCASQCYFDGSSNVSANYEVPSWLSSQKELALATSTLAAQDELADENLDDSTIHIC